MEPEKMSNQGLVFGILGIIVWMIFEPIVILLGVPGLIFSILSLKAQKKVKSIIGIVLNSLVLFWWLVIYLFRALGFLFKEKFIFSLSIFSTYSRNHKSVA